MQKDANPKWVIKWSTKNLWFDGGNGKEGVGRLFDISRTLVTNAGQMSADVANKQATSTTYSDVSILFCHEQHLEIRHEHIW